MGSAIARRLKGQYTLWVCDKDTSKLRDIAAEVLLAADLVQRSEVVILAVKPQDFSEILELIKKVGVGKDKLFISIAAGITAAYIEQNLPQARVIRVMPNLPAQVGEGITALSKGALASLEDLDIAAEIFGYLGKTIIVDEGMMGAVTAISGSGPAYVCFFLESKGLSAANVPSALSDKFLAEFKEAAEALGFSPQEAKLLVEQTYKGTISLLKKKGALPSELRCQVTSKGGTTEAALEVLSAGGSWTEAALAAKKRAEELSRGG